MMNSKTALAIGFALVAAIATAQSPVESLNGKKMPSFSMTDLSGKKHTNTSLKGKVVILDFWASWCGPCKAASPTMQALHQKYASKGLVVIGANTEGQGDGFAIAKKYAAEHRFGYTFTAKNEDFAQKLGIQGIPTFIFIDKKGVVRRVEVGFNPGSTPASFEDTVKRLL